MAKGQKRSGREPKKPKAKPKLAGPTTGFPAAKPEPDKKRTDH